VAAAGEKKVDPRFFVRTDEEVPGPPRDLVGYGRNPPRFTWPGGVRVAVQIVINYEEGSEKSFPMGDGVNDSLHESPIVLEGQRDLAVESTYEYGSRAGIWRLFRVLDAAEVPATVFATAVALERNKEVVDRILERGDEVAGHGYRWIKHHEMSRDEEREVIRRAVESFTQTVGTRPLGWYCREMSVNTRELVVEEGGFLYDSDSYNDDLPYWTVVHRRAHLVVPYSLVVNDARYVRPMGFGSPQHFLEIAQSTLEGLLRDRDGVARMMSVGLHPRLAGQPGRADALARFIDYAQSQRDVWIARRIDIARAFIERYPADQAPTLAGDSHWMQATPNSGRTWEANVGPQLGGGDRCAPGS
jgi:peptidoglycan/xylan/chitin deacetylase (PgdA/CDA1 family)